MASPQLRVEATGQTYALDGDLLTVGRGSGVDIALEHPSVSRLHAEFVRRAEEDEDDLYSWWCKNQLRELKGHPLIERYSRPVEGALQQPPLDD